MKKRKMTEKIKWRHRHPWLFGSMMTVVILFLLGTAVVSIYVATVIKSVPTVTSQELTSDASSNMYDKDGNLIWSSALNKRVYVKSKDIPKTYSNLLLSTEDQTFYKNAGFSPSGLLNAALSTVKSATGQGTVRGGSSIEQQLIKLTVFSTSNKDRTVDRKIKEFFLAQQLYHNYSKKQILEFYVNKMSLGEGSYGAQTISETYFGKTLKQLSISQQAIIAGLGQAPSIYNLYSNPKVVQNRRDTVLKTGLEKKVITKDQYKTAIAEPVTKDLKKRHWMETSVTKTILRNNAYVSSALDQVSAKGYDLTKTPLQIATALDPSKNAYVKKAADNKKYYQDSTEQSAITITNPKTGNIVAQYGGRHQKRAFSYNRATSTQRSSGSGIKPLLDYGPAIEYFGWATTHALDGTEYRYPGTGLVAKNFDNVSYNSITMQNALRLSANTPAIRTLNAVGSAKAGQFLSQIGMAQTNAPAGSQAIGLDVSTEQMATAYGAVSNGGTYHAARYVTSLKFSDNSVKTYAVTGKRAMKASTAFMLTSMMEGVPNTGGTAPSARIDGVHQAMKTGTVGYSASARFPANANMDVWMNGFTKSTSISMWLGYDKPMLKKHYITDAASAMTNVNLYRDLMVHFSKETDADNSEWAQPSTVTRLSGMGLTAQYEPNDKAVALGVKEPAAIKLKKAKTYKTYLSKKRDKDALTVKLEDPSYQKKPRSYKIGSWEKETNKRLATTQKKLDKANDRIKSAKETLEGE
ncbi:transglycosylase domain-containing protein [Dellaglioa sp. L3N]